MVFIKSIYGDKKITVNDAIMRCAVKLNSAFSATLK